MLLFLLILENFVSSALDDNMRILFQPMYAAMAPWVQAFVRVEQERDSLQSTSTELARKRFLLKLFPSFEVMILIENVCELRRKQEVS